ncbi:MAG: efflux RND transporter periplasmic adaptor subunit [Burkholderiales bacterium]
MRRKTWIVMGAAVAALVIAAVAWRQWPATVTVATVTRGPAVDAVYATGVVEPSVMVPVAPRAGARLLTLEVDEGARVKRGQLLARLEAPDLDLTVQELAARERLARTQYERTKALVDEKFLSPAELDRVRTELQAAQAGVQRAQAQRDYTLLQAPADGLVIRRDGERGQFIPAGQAVFTLSCCAPLRVAAEVDEEDIARVKVGQQVVLRSDALPNQVFDGEVAEITPKGDPVARSYRVRMRFANVAALEAAGGRSGMTMDANIIIAKLDNVLLVPTRALRSGALWVLEDGRLHKRSVRTGVAGTERTQVLDGLKDGSQVVLTPVEALREGQRARAASSPASSVPASAPSPTPAASR